MILNGKTGITSRMRWLDKSRIEVEKSTLTNEEKVWLLVRMLFALSNSLGEYIKRIAIEYITK